MAMTPATAEQPPASDGANTLPLAGAIGGARPVAPSRRLRRRVLDTLAAFDGASLDAAILRGCYRYLLGPVALVARARARRDESLPRTSRWERPR